jgi:hypothetical protein
MAKTFFIDYQMDFCPPRQLTEEDHKALEILRNIAIKAEADHKEQENKRIAPTPLSQQIKEHLQFFDRPLSEHKLYIPWTIIETPPTETKQPDGTYTVVWTYPNGDLLQCYQIEYNEELQQVTKFGGHTQPVLSSCLFFTAKPRQ